MVFFDCQPTTKKGTKMLIGGKIKELRKAKNLTLVELAKLSGIQIATLSRIENLKMTGTVESHISIAKALGVDLTLLYKEAIKEETTNEIKTPKSLTDIFAHNDQAYFEILTNNILNKKMMPVLLRIEPSGKTTPEQNQPGTEKFVFVLEGEVEIRLGEDSFKLKKNNTFYFDASIRHHFVNSAQTVTKVICVVTPVAL